MLSLESEANASIQMEDRAMLETGFVFVGITAAIVFVLGGLFSWYGRNWNEF
jgi:hypothetical protein